MKKRTAFFSILALVLQVAQGLLLHPYQTMQSLVREKLLIWLSFLPSFVLVVLGGAWFVGVGWLARGNWLLGGDWLAGGWMKAVVGFRFFAWWISFFCLYWQLLLLYLLFRFWFGFKRV